MHQNDNIIYIIFILPEGKEGLLPCQVEDRSHEYCGISAKPQQQRVIKPPKSIDVCFLLRIPEKDNIITANDKKNEIQHYMSLVRKIVTADKVLLREN